MNFFKKLFQNKSKSPEKENENSSDDKDKLSLDELFVRNFIKKGGKFLYCSNEEELTHNLSNILKENKWDNVVCFNEELNEILAQIKSAKTSKIIQQLPFFSNCESLIAEDGAIMFSSKQLKEKKLKDLPINFIVYAKTSQIVNSMGEGVMGVRMRAEKNSPTIVSSVKDFLPNRSVDDFMSYGNNNAKTLYLLLLEDL